MKIKIAGLLAVCLLTLHPLLHAQKNPAPERPAVDSLSVTDLLIQLEAASGFRMFFDSSQLNHNKTAVTINDQSLPKLLESLFAGSNYSYAIDSIHKMVFITQGVVVATNLPHGLLRRDGLGGMYQNDSLMKNRRDPFGIATDRLPDASVQAFEVGTPGTVTPKEVGVSGYVVNERTGEPIQGITLIIDKTTFLTSGNDGLFFSTLPVGTHELSVEGIGIRSISGTLTVHAAGKFTIQAQEKIATLKEVIVSSKQSSNLRSNMMGAVKLDLKTIKQIPTVFGEADVLRAITTLPGVKTVGEASTGFNVRGGSTDQNLILYNENTIYNPSHFFGMFAAFNPEIIDNIELYKSSIPAQYGGRLASVLNITNRTGNKREWSGSAGIGPVTSRFNIEGPLVKEKTSIVAGGRLTYANWMINLIPDEYNQSKASFNDFNIGIHHKLDSNNRLLLSAYMSHDKFNLNSDTSYQYANANFSLKWQRNFSKKFNGELITGYDNYKYRTESLENPVNAYRLSFNIRQLFAKMNFNYFINQTHGLEFGASGLLYRIKPGTYEPGSPGSLVVADTLETEQARELAAYLTHRLTLSPNFSISTGLRYSLYNYLGARTVSYYTPGEPVTEATRTSEVYFSKGKNIQHYGGPELRISARLSVTPDFSIKAGYNSQRQYIHMLSNTTAISPTDIWKLSDPNIKPQKGSQYSLGFYHNLKSNTIEASLEVYYKKIKDYLDYKPGAVLIMNHYIETDVINTNGKAYGAEFLVKKTSGKITGWVSYTYSRILLKTTDASLGNLVNNGEEYAANYDKPHDVTLTASYRLSHRYSFSLNSTYSTGRPITFPIAKYYYGGSERVLYSDRNKYRIPDYFRTDIAITLEGNHKVHKLTHNSWTFGCYNLLGRKNPYSVYFASEDGSVNGYKLSIFGSAIPFINYNIRF